MKVQKQLKIQTNKQNKIVVRLVFLFVFFINGWCSTEILSAKKSCQVKHEWWKRQQLCKKSLASANLKNCRLQMLKFCG